MIVDFHTHIFPPEIIDQRQAHVLCEPTFAALYGNPAARMATADDLLASMDRAGIDASVVLGFPWEAHETLLLHNDYLLATADRHRDRIIAFPIIQPTDQAAALAEIRRWNGEATGIGELRPDDQHVGLDGQAGEFLAKVSSAGLPLLFHVSEPVGHEYPGKRGLDVGSFYAFLHAHEKILAVGAHWGGGLPFYAHMPEVRSVLRRIYVDTAATSLLYAPSVFASTIELLGADRILFGSDFPLLSQKVQLGNVRALKLSPEAEDAILGLNALRLLAEARALREERSA